MSCPSIQLVSPLSSYLYITLCFLLSNSLLPEVVLTELKAITTEKLKAISKVYLRDEVSPYLLSLKENIGGGEEERIHQPDISYY